MNPNDQNQEKPTVDSVEIPSQTTNEMPGAPEVSADRPLESVGDAGLASPVVNPAESTVASRAADSPRDRDASPTDAAPSQDTNASDGHGPVAAPAAVITAPPSSRKGKKKLVVLLVAIVVILLLAGGAAGAYFGVYLPNQPQKITADALANTANSQKLQSTAFEGEVSFEGGEVSKVVSSVTFAGSIDMKARASDVNLSVNTLVTKISLDAKSTDGKSIYLKLSGLDGLDKLLAAAGGSGSSQSAAVSQYAPLIAQVNNQWFVIDESLVKQASGGTIPDSAGALSSEDAQKIGDIYKKHKFLNIDKRLADESIHGVASYHVQATINKDELKGFMQDLKAANLKDLKLDQKDIDAIDKVDFSKYPFELWVGKKDRLVTQLSTRIEEKGTTFKVRIALKDANKPVKVEKPSNAKSILELLGGFSGGAASPGANTSTNPLLMGL